MPELELKSYTYKLPTGDVVFKFVHPSEVVYDKYENERQRDLSGARGALVKAVVKSHTGVQLDSIFEQYPAVKHGLALAIQREAGAMFEILEGEPQAS